AIAAGPAATRRCARRLTLAVGAEGVIWGAGFVLFAALGSLNQELFALLLGAGVAAGAAMSLGAYLPAFRARFYAATLPYAAWAVAQGDGLHLLLAAIVVLFSLAIGRLAGQFSAGFAENLRLRYANAALADELRAQRDAAERASLEKSRFLAAASHDLRQPVHALGLFAGALRHGMPEPARQAVLDQVAASLEAMDGLFASLLDLSRLDAGVIEPRPRAFALHPLLARLVAEYAAEAAARGIGLRLVPTEAVVQTDPVLLERMLRNLIANAVRYTERGRVLVGARRQTRDGARVRVEVWDTGPGIAEADQPTVFEEFAQLANPERARGKGLGLGLAIVRRLSHLIDCPVALRSRPGRGSVFSVAVPRAVALPLPVA
ncbi:sensor histidine kinase, partial [Acidisphaera rubrifaciens]|uniref:sensor histidine kinase n=1 Tax=Acidisphaera rubrifaciens TaxID=50715 RepID=UPI0011DD364A